MTGNDTTQALTLADFLGTWRLARDIFHADGTRAHMQGKAWWRATPEGALYHEAGTLEMAGQRFSAERRYRWSQGLEVFFDDGRFFHCVPASGGTATHWCDPDQYDVVYDFSQWRPEAPRWRVTWHVSGPRKSYRMLSDYALVDRDGSA